MNGIATRHDLSRNEWLEAAALGALRMAVNDTQRARVRDRGHRLNILNDLIGAIGELTCLAYLEGLGATSINHNVLSLESFVDDVDFRFQLQGHRYSTEVKCELLRLAAQERLQLADLSREALSANLAGLISMARQ